ncbi:hypothetical protein M9Y10_040750 [Tritrichomonas musculus]|uniref:BEACH domain-containing protein n=1 Tax=Tritrichomonas musculus TaxID=1915356 RepID=A0ABR2K2I9_9EUKA
MIISYFLYNDRVLNEDRKIKLELKKITNLWIDNKISNFDYIMMLNIFSGRNFNDFDQYPVFPWILADYTSNKLNLKDEKSYRNLSHPVGTFNKNFLYTTGYSNRYSVLNWLCRLEPFSTKSQNQNQELYLKFESISESFNYASNNDNDFRELIPEFFFLPEFLMSFDGDNVELPPWSNNSPFEFIYKHRKALESEFVSSSINNWIDLIWGYKQDGADSHLADNTFSPEMEDFGQIPKKLFEKKHPKRETFVPPSSMFSSFSIIFTNATPPVTFYVSSEEKVLTFKMVDSKGNFFTHNFDLSSNVSEKNEVELECKNNIEIDDNKPFFISSNIIGFIDNNKKQVNFFNCEKETIEKSSIQNYEIELTESDQQGHLVIYSIDSSVTLFNMNLSNFSKPRIDAPLVKRIASERANHSPKLHLKHSPSQKKLSSSASNLLSPSKNTLSSTSSLSDVSQDSPSDLNTSKCSSSFYTHKYKIECVGISQAFKTFVCGTRDDCVLFCQLDMSEMKINRVVHVNGRPKKIVITENMGLVVILLTKLVNYSYKQELAFYNINGVFVRSLEYDDKIICEMTCASSMPGCFDYLITSDDLNRIFVLEAFSSKFEELEFKLNCNSKIIQLKYIREESLIIAICNDGSVNVIFYYIDESKDQ